MLLGSIIIADIASIAKWAELDIHSGRELKPWPSLPRDAPDDSNPGTENQRQDTLKCSKLFAHIYSMPTIYVHKPGQAWHYMALNTVRPLVLSGAEARHSSSNLSFCQSNRRSCAAVLGMARSISDHPNDPHSNPETAVMKSRQAGHFSLV